MSRLANMKSMYGLGQGGQGRFGTHQTAVKQSMLAPGQSGGNQVNQIPPQVTVGTDARMAPSNAEYAF
jgi:hypothetical protein